MESGSADPRRSSAPPGGECQAPHPAEGIAFNKLPQVLVRGLSSKRKRFRATIPAALKRFPAKYAICCRDLDAKSQEHHAVLFKANRSGSSSFSRIGSDVRQRQLLVQRKIEQGLARDLHLVALGDDLRTCARSTADTGADRSSLASA